MTGNPAIRWSAALLLSVAAAAQETPPAPPPPTWPIPLPKLEPLPQLPSIPFEIPLQIPRIVLPPVPLHSPLPWPPLERKLPQGLELVPPDPVAAARAENDRAWLDYLHVREILIARGFAGKWVAIAGGRLLPVAGGELAPADSIDALCFLIELDHGAALHRYLFRVGEEGEVAYRFFAPNLPWSDALGTGLFRATFLGEPGSDAVFAPDRLHLARAGRKHSFAYGETGVALELADPTGATRVPAVVTPSSACDGTFVLSSETAAKLGLERFEIPGTCWYGPEDGPRYACRRARVRWRVPELGLDATIPVAIWPPRGAAPAAADGPGR